MKKVAICFIAVCLFFGMHASAGTAETPRISASLDRTRITIGDRVRLTLEVDAPEGSEVEFPDLKDHVGDLTLKESGKEGPTQQQGEWIRHSVWAVLTAYEVKPYFISPIPVTVRSPSGDQTTVETLQLFVEVVSVVREGETMTDIRDIKGPVGLPGPPLGMWFWGGVCLLIFLVIGTLLCLKKKAQPKPVAVLPAHLRALQALEKIEAMGLDRKNIKEYYFLVSGVLRRYLEDRFGLRAPEQTTEEFLGSVVANHLLQDGQKRLLRSFLEHCDLVKFAAYAPKREEAAWASKTVRDFIEETKPQEESKNRNGL